MNDSRYPAIYYNIILSVFGLSDMAPTIRNELVLKNDFYAKLLASLCKRMRRYDHSALFCQKEIMETSLKDHTAIKHYNGPIELTSLGK